MISIKDYANSKGVTPQSIYQHIKRYSDELDEHVQKVKNVKMLDDFAVNFLDKKIEGDTIVIIDTEKDEEIKRLQDENKMLLLKLSMMQDKALAQSDKIIELQSALIEDKSKKKRFSFFNK